MNRLKEVVATATKVIEAINPQDITPKLKDVPKPILDALADADLLSVVGKVGPEGNTYSVIVKDLLDNRDLFKLTKVRGFMLLRATGKKSIQLVYDRKRL